MVITSRDNPRYKSWLKLHTKKYRDDMKKFLVEGELLIGDIIESGGMIDEFIISGTEDNPKKLLERVFLSNPCMARGQEIETITLSGDLFKELANTENGRNIIGVVNYPKVYDNPDDAFSDIAGDEGESDLLILDRIQDPGNLGTIIRTAEALGFKMIISLKGTTDEFSPKVVRSTAGSIMRIPIVHLNGAQELLSFSERQGIRLIALDGKSDLELNELSYEGNIGLIVGNEGSGISEEILDMSKKVKIPMKGKIESLNAGIAAAIGMYEISKRKE